MMFISILGLDQIQKYIRVLRDLVNSVEDYILVDDVNNLVELIIDVDENGLLKQLGYSLSTHFQ